MPPLAPIVALITPRVLPPGGDSVPEFRLLEDLRSCAFAEIRYDLFPDRTQWPRLAQRLRNLHPRITLIATLRLERDGGRWPNEQAGERAQILAASLQTPGAPEWLDVEGDPSEADADLLILARQQNISVILSAHDFHAIPDSLRLDSLARRALALGCAGCKIAAMTPAAEAVEPLYAWSRQWQSSFRFLSAFAMGPAGRESRLQCLSQGSTATYATLEEALAPGQWSVEDLRDAWLRTTLQLGPAKPRTSPQ